MNSAATASPPAVLVTGATSGLGSATAQLLAERGWRVFAAGRSAERRRALDGWARERGLALDTVELDVTTDDSVERAIAEIERRGVSLDALVNNAGIAIVAPMEEISFDDLRRQYETNVFGAVRVARRVLPEMRRRRRGRIVNVSSIAGRVVLPLFGPYSGSKFALEATSDALRLELHPFGIRVVVIEPGYIRTGMERAAQELSSRYMAGAAASPYRVVYEGFRRAWSNSTSGSRTLPEDCARVVLRALTDPHPRSRYTVTREARLTVLMRRLLSDRVLDRQILKATGLDRAIANP
ncbi:MAG TPA: SDR family oxidoreductase [Candidatus Acidoferrales bacterium]|nr:SDR family oxidoreductase [Candidatus Acidoferrales bacterium]